MKICSCSGISLQLLNAPLFLHLTCRCLFRETEGSILSTSNMGDSATFLQATKSKQPSGACYRYNPYIGSGSCKEFASSNMDDKHCRAAYRGQPSFPTNHEQGASLLPPPYVDSSRYHHALAPFLRHFAFPVTSRSDGGRLGEIASPKNDMARLFIGQLPYAVTDEQLNHAISIATGGLVLHHIERIVNWKKNRAPTGCVHAYCMPSEVDAILSAHQRVLFDEEGVWCAWNDHELGALQDYVHRHAAQSKASGCLPSSLLTVEFARSTYVPDVRYTVKQFDGRRAVQ